MKHLSFGLLMLPLAGIAQQQFQHVYYFEDRFDGGALVERAEGGYAVVGPWYSKGNGSALLAVDLWGNVDGMAVYPGDDVFLFDLEQTSDGGYILAGYVEGDTTSNDGLLIKTDTVGNVLWAKSYFDIDDERFHSVKPTSDGGYVATGYTQSVGSGSSDLLVVKTNSSGAIEWATAAGEAAPDVGNEVIETSDGGYLAVGHSFSVIQLSGSGQRSGASNFYFVKLSSTGTEQWTRLAGGFMQDEAQDVLEISDGYVATGWSESFSPGGEPDAAICEFDDSGTFVWADAYDASDNYDEGYAIDRSGSGGYTVMGSTSESIDAGISLNALAFEVDDTGDVLWAMAYGDDSGQDEFYDGIATSDGGFAMTGRTELPSSDDGLYLVKTDEDGESTCNEGAIDFVRRDSLWENGVGMDSVMDVTHYIRADSIFVDVNHETPDDTSLCLITSISEVGANGEIIVYPNPAADEVVVRLPSRASVEIVSLTGQVLDTYAEQAGAALIRVSHLQSGLYVLVVRDDHSHVIAVKKVIVR